MAGRPKRTALEAFRTKFWFAGLKTQAQVENGYQLTVKTSFHFGRHLEEYELGTSSPSHQTLTFLERGYPGSRLLYDHGFQDDKGVVPLWTAMGNAPPLWPLLEAECPSLTSLRLQGTPHQDLVAELLQHFGWDSEGDFEVMLEHGEISLSFRAFSAFIAIYRQTTSDLGDTGLITRVLNGIVATAVAQLFKPYGLANEAESYVIGLMDDYMSEILLRLRISQQNQ